MYAHTGTIVVVAFPLNSPAYYNGKKLRKPFF
jgi:hypothetical protein